MGGVMRINGGGWLFLALLIAALFGGCTLLSARVSGDWWPAFLIWTALVIPLKVVNDRWKRMKWRGMEFLLWSVILLIAVNLLWLRFGVS